VSDTEITYDLSLLDESSRAWQQSEALRLFYGDLYSEIGRHCVGSSLLEIGSGIGVSSDFIKHVTTTDLVKTKYVDRAMSAYAIEPTESGSGWTSIFALDMLHHLREPFKFLASASQCLEANGRIVLLEPAATWLGRIFYKLFHHEPIEPREIGSPFEFEANGTDGEFANMGMGVGLFVRNEAVVSERLQAMGLKVLCIRYRDIIGYPLTGGYSAGQKAPTSVVRLCLRFEKTLPQWLLKRLGLRMCVVLEKTSDGV
jgi:hypothetical protein